MGRAPPAGGDRLQDFFDARSDGLGPDEKDALDAALDVRVPRHPIRSLRHRLPLLRRSSVAGPTLKHQALKSHLPPDASIVEAGAHEGTDTVELAHAFPDGHVHAFEPIPDLYERLQRNTAEYSNVTTYPLALGDRETAESMWIGGGADDASSSLLAPKAHLRVYPEITFERTVPVKVTTLRGWAEREKIKRIDGMWLDMQGHELAALKAAGDLLSTTRALISEISSVELYDGAPLWPEVREWLEGEGFKIAAESRHKGAGADGAHSL